MSLSVRVWESFLFYSNAVLDTPFSLPVSASRDDLSHLINQLLDGKQKEFDFLINSTLIRSQLESVINQLQINTVSKDNSSWSPPLLFLHKKEEVVQIEYVERSPPPKLDREFAHNDWLSAVHCIEN